MIKNNFYFWYIDSRSSENYLKKVANYLKFQESEVLKKFGGDFVFDFYNMRRHSDYNINGFLHVADVDDSDRARDVCSYILSRDRVIIPKVVSCSEEENYSFIEKILKENYGNDARLSGGFLGLGYLSNERNIRVR